MSTEAQPGTEVAPAIGGQVVSKDAAAARPQRIRDGYSEHAPALVAVAEEYAAAAAAQDWSVLGYDSMGDSSAATLGIFRGSRRPGSRSPGC